MYLLDDGMGGDVWVSDQRDENPSQAGVCLSFNDAAGETYLPAQFQQFILSRPS